MLSEEEVTEILKSISNIKHKALIMTIYSGGLRISELINLKVKDIDSDRMQIKVTQSKGKKDRYTLLGKKTLLIYGNILKNIIQKNGCLKAKKEVSTLIVVYTKFLKQH